MVKLETRKKLIRITTIPRSLSILLRNQLNFMNQYFDVIGISSQGSYLLEVYLNENIKTYAVNMTRTISLYKDFRALCAIVKIIRNEKPQIVHTHTPKAGTLGMIAAWLCRVPVRMHTVAGLPLLETKGLKRKLLDFIEKITYSCATNVYPNSFGLYEIILNHGYTKEIKLKIIGNGSSNGIDIIHFSRSQITDEITDKTKENYGINQTDFIFIFIGRIVKSKGINELITAFKIVNKHNPETKLLLVGEFEHELDPLDKQTIIDIKQHSNIIFTGFKSDIRPFLAIAKTLVLPSYREGLPNSPLQACAMGIPSIVSNINGCNEIIIHEHNGLLVPPKSTEALQKAMERLLLDSKLYLKLASNARESIITRYNQNSLWEQIKMEYEEQLKNADCYEL